MNCDNKDRLFIHHSQQYVHRNKYGHARDNSIVTNRTEHECRMSTSGCRESYEKSSTDDRVGNDCCSGFRMQTVPVGNAPCLTFVSRCFHSGRFQTLISAPITLRSLQRWLSLSITTMEMNRSIVRVLHSPVSEPHLSSKLLSSELSHTQELPDEIYLELHQLDNCALQEICASTPGGDTPQQLRLFGGATLSYLEESRGNSTMQIQRQHIRNTPYQRAI